VARRHRAITANPNSVRVFRAYHAGQRGSARGAIRLRKAVARLYCGRTSIQFNEEAALEFFNLKTKQKVNIPDTDLKKRRSVRTTSGGKRQERYAVIAELHEGGVKPLQLFKFVNKETFDSLNVPEVS
jgi:hypothetical protein